ncbi:hypothetical protein WJX77_010762 [Trebouxia sp. C0004]
MLKRRWVLAKRHTSRQLVADTLQELGYLLDEQAGEALGALTEAQLQNVRVKGAGLNVREINALLIRFKPQGAANLSRASFTEMLRSGTISRPDAEVLDTVERYYTHRMMACSSLRMAEQIYRAAQSMPGASTTKYFLAQHGLQINVGCPIRPPTFS